MKQCPYCAEEIQEAAIKCRHCGEFLDGSDPRMGLKKAKVPWYLGTTFIIIAIFSVGPLALPLVWLRPKTSLISKLTITIAVILLSVVLYIATRRSLEVLTEYYNMMQEF